MKRPEDRYGTNKEMHEVINMGKKSASISIRWGTVF